MNRTVRSSYRLFGVSALIVFTILFPLAGRSMGQEQAGIIGQVTDESGAVLPGVTATATSPALQLPQVIAVTNERGEYRLSPLPIGTYAVEYALPGFQTMRREGLRLTVGFTARVDIVLKVGDLAESITVSGAAPTVDVTATSSTTQLTREALELIPTNRNGFQALMNQAPGTRTQVDTGGNFNSQPAFSAFGQTAQPWQAVEGILTLNGKESPTGSYVDYTSFEEAKIQTLGNDAEVGNRGIYINAIVKSGGNDFHGGAFYAYTNHRFQGDNIDDALRGQGIASPAEIELQDDFSGELGGRLVRDKVWFYASGRQRRSRATIIACLKPDGTPCVNVQRQPAATVKVTYQLSRSNKFIGFSQWVTKINRSGPSRLVAWETRTKQFPMQVMPKGEWQGVNGNSLVASVLVGRWHSLTPIEGFTDRPANFDLVTGERSGASSGPGVGQWGVIDRTQARGSVSWYKPDWVGNHEIRAGLEYHSVLESRGVRSRGAAGNYELQFRNRIPDQIAVWNYPVTPDTRIHYLGTYVQDRWTIGRRLTLNLGLRFTHDKGFRPEVCREAADPPGHVAFPAACFDRIDVPVWTPVSPRLRAAYDLSGDGRTLIKGGWGRFDKMRFTDEIQIADPNVIAQALYRWRDPNGNRAYDPGEVNLDTNGPDFLSVGLLGLGGALANGVVNPNETQPWTDEYMLQFERELAANFAVRVTGAYSRALNQYRLVNSLRPYDTYSIPITNRDPGPDGVVGTADDPGTSITYYEYPVALRGAAFQAPMIVNDPKANQTYRTIEVALSKRLSNNWQFMASYTATKKNIPLPTNVGGGNSPAFNTVDPNSEIFAADNTWELGGRLAGSYMFPRNVLVSANFAYRNGEPLARTALFRGGTTIPSITLKVEPLRTNFRPSISILNMRVEKRVSVGRGQTVAVRLNIYNTLNANPVTNSVVQSGSNFGRATAILDPRLAELSVSYSF
ncbi:MAG: TonB-dependent receptor [Acidobacteria bacterium]|nr:TonB-dependent receptor [Acidobacteriota bacterium]